MSNVIPVKVSDNSLLHIPMSTATQDKIPVVFIPVSTITDNILGVDSDGNLYVPAGSIAAPVRWDMYYSDIVLVPTPTQVKFTSASVNGGIVFDDTSYTIITPDTATYIIYTSFRFSLDSMTNVGPHKFVTSAYVRIIDTQNNVQDHQVILDTRYATAVNVADLQNTMFSSAIPLSIPANSKVGLVLTGGGSNISTQALDIKFSAWKMQL